MSIFDAKATGGWNNSFEHYHEWAEVASMLEVRGPIAMRFEALQEVFHIVIECRVTVDDVDNPGTPINLVLQKRVPRGINSKAEMVNFIRTELIHHFFRHEADERIHFNGQRHHIPNHEHA